MPPIQAFNRPSLEHRLLLPALQQRDNAPFTNHLRRFLGRVEQSFGGVVYIQAVTAQLVACRTGFTRHPRLWRFISIMHQLIVCGPFGGRLIFLNRTNQVTGTLTFPNSPPSGLGTLGAPMDSEWNAGQKTSRKLAGMIDGQFCYLYE
jgi:hypothetical protein